MEMKSQIFFADGKIKKEFDELNNGKIEEQELYSQLKQAFENLKNNAFCGIQIPKNLFQKHILKNMALIIYGNIICQMHGGYYILLAGKG